MATDSSAGPVMNGVSIPLGGVGADTRGTAGVPSSQGALDGSDSGGPTSDTQLPPRKRRVSIDLSNYFSGGGPAGGSAGDDAGTEAVAKAGSESFETKRARNNSISEILSSII